MCVSFNATFRNQREFVLNNASSHVVISIHATWYLGSEKFQASSQVDNHFLLPYDMAHADHTRDPWYVIHLLFIPVCADRREQSLGHP